MLTTSTPAPQQEIKLHVDAEHLYVNQYFHQHGKTRCRPLAQMANTAQNVSAVLVLYPTLNAGSHAAAA